MAGQRRQQQQSQRQSVPHSMEASHRHRLARGLGLSSLLSAWQPGSSCQAAACERMYTCERARAAGQAFAHGRVLPKQLESLIEADVTYVVAVRADIRVLATPWVGSARGGATPAAGMRPHTHMSRQTHPQSHAQSLINCAITHAGIHRLCNHTRRNQHSPVPSPPRGVRLLIHLHTRTRSQRPQGTGRPVPLLSPPTQDPQWPL